MNESIEREFPGLRQKWFDKMKFREIAEEFEVIFYMRSRKRAHKTMHRIDPVEGSVAIAER